VSDNDAAELANYFDATSQLPPLYCADATLAMDNEPLADIVAEIYEIIEDMRTLATQSLRTEEINPIDQRDAVNVVDVTNGTDATYLYYYDLDGYRKAGFQFALDCAAGTVTVTIEGTVMDDGTAPASCTYIDITNDTFGVASLVAAAGAASDLWIDNSEKLSLFKYVRIRVVAATGGNTGDWRIDYKALY
jgi:hypothetical protein